MHYTRPGPRFTIGQIMIATAVLAVLLAGAFAEPNNRSGFNWIFSPRFFLNLAIEGSLIAVCINRRSLSGELQIVIVALIGILLADFFYPFALAIGISTGTAPNFRIIAGIYLVIRGLLSIVSIWGFWRTFKDIENRLNAHVLESQGTTPKDHASRRVLNPIVSSQFKPDSSRLEFLPPPESRAEKSFGIPESPGNSEGPS